MVLAMWMLDSKDPGVKYTQIFEIYRVVAYRQVLPVMEVNVLYLEVQTIKYAHDHRSCLCKCIFLHPITQFQTKDRYIHQYIWDHTKFILFFFSRVF